MKQVIGKIEAYNGKDYSGIKIGGKWYNFQNDEFRDMLKSGKITKGSLVSVITNDNNIVSKIEVLNDLNSNNEIENNNDNIKNDNNIQQKSNTTNIETKINTDKQIPKNDYIDFRIAEFEFKKQTQIEIIKQTCLKEAVNLVRGYIETYKPKKTIKDLTKMVCDVYNSFLNELINNKESNT